MMNPNRQRTTAAGTPLKDAILPVVLPCLLAICSGVAGTQCSAPAPASFLKSQVGLGGGLCMSEQPATSQLLSDINRVKSSNSIVQAPRNAIPLPPSRSLPALRKDANAKRGQRMPQKADLKALDRAARGPEKVRLEEIYEGLVGLEESFEGSFNFAHPGYRFGVHMGGKTEMKALGWGRANDDDDGWEENMVLGFGRTSGKMERQVAQEKEFVEQDFSEHLLVAPRGIDWTLYSGIILCGPFFFGLVVYGLYVRCMRQSRLPSDLDGSQTFESDDEDVPVLELRRSMANWRSLWRAILISSEPRGLEFPGGMTREQINKLPLIPHCEEAQCTPGGKFRCIICLNDVKDKEMLREIPRCGHRFHACCVDPWLERSATCPLCRRDVVVEEDEEEEKECVQTEEMRPLSSGPELDDPESIDEDLSLQEPLEVDVVSQAASTSGVASYEEILAEQNLDILPESRNSQEEGLDPATPDVVDAASPSGFFLPDAETLDPISPDSTAALPPSFGAAGSETEEWSEAEADIIRSTSATDVDGWEIVGGGA